MYMLSKRYAANHVECITYASMQSQRKGRFLSRRIWRVKCEKAQLNALKIAFNLECVAYGIFLYRQYLYRQKTSLYQQFRCTNWVSVKSMWRVMILLMTTTVHRIMCTSLRCYWAFFNRKSLGQVWLDLFSYVALYNPSKQRRVLNPNIYPGWCLLVDIN